MGDPFTPMSLYSVTKLDGCLTLKQRIVELKSWESQLHIFWKMGLGYATIDEGIILPLFLEHLPLIKS